MRILAAVLWWAFCGCGAWDARAEETAAGRAETLSADHPDARAVRAILDANGLRRKTVEGVAVVEGGRIVELYLQECGIRELTDDIGRLSRLRRLHLYGDRSLGLPLLEQIGPGIGRCSELEELLLNNNALTSLPETVVELRKIKRLSIADNRISHLPPPVRAWVERLDPRGLASQRP